MPNWQPKIISDAVVFDCDGTLSRLEGIDRLAEMNDISAQVKSLTKEAMSYSGLNADLYARRLNLVKPTYEQLITLGQEYFAALVPDTSAVIQLFNKFKKQIYIISAGLNPAVKNFGAALDVSSDKIFAVDLEFTDAGEYKKFDTTSPLINNDGKKIILSEIRKTAAHITYIGDGMNDLSCADFVDNFIGYGGIFYRESIEKFCTKYIYCESLTPLLALTFTAEEMQQLTMTDYFLYQKGVDAIQHGKVKYSH